jgi:arylsulfatase A-like enzyme
VNPGLTNWANELTQQGYSPKVIGYIDMVSHDLSDPNVQVDPKVLNWDGGGMKGITRLTDTDVLGTQKWQQQQPGMSVTEEDGWNGYRGKNNWDSQRLPPRNPSGPPEATRAAYSRDSTDTKVLTDRAIRYCTEEGRRGRKWALHLSLLKPHPPWVAVEPFVDLYSPSLCNAQLSKVRSTPHHETTLHPWLAAVHGIGDTAAKFITGNSILTMRDERLDALKATYFALVTELDFHLGRLFDALMTTNQFDTTLIVFTADHGEQLGDHRLIGKLGFFDQSYHIPCIVRDPRPSANPTRGTTLPASVITEAVDIAPTILHFCVGNDLRFAQVLPPQFEGKSLLPLLEGGKFHQWKRTAAHWEVDWRWWTLEGGSGHPDLFQKLCDQYSLLPDERRFLVHRTSRWKLVIFPKMEPLLFDMNERNGDETRNLAKSPAHRDILTSLLMECVVWKMKYSGSAGERALTRFRIGYDNKLRTMNGHQVRTGMVMVSSENGGAGADKVSKL